MVDFESGFAFSGGGRRGIAPDTEYPFAFFSGSDVEVGWTWDSGV